MFKKKTKNKSQAIQIRSGTDSGELFEGQRGSEKILLLVKRHPMTLYKLGLFLVLLGLANVITFALAGASIYSSSILGISLIVGGFLAFKNWYLWWASHYILTDERIISIEQKSFFNRVVSEAALDNIMKVSYEIKGPYQTFMDYGSVLISTTGYDVSDIAFESAPNPYRIQQRVVRAAKVYGEEKYSGGSKDGIVLR